MATYVDFIEIWTDHPASTSDLSGIILSMGSANERRRYIVTPPLIGRAHTQNDPYLSIVFALKTLDQWYMGVTAAQQMTCMMSVSHESSFHITGTDQHDVGIPWQLILSYKGPFSVSSSE